MGPLGIEMRQVCSMSKSGVVKNWNEDKGFGFIGRTRACKRA